MKRNYTYAPCDKSFHLFLPSEEYLEWKNAADLLNVSVSEYVRQMVRRGSISFVIREEVELSGIRDILTRYGRIEKDISLIAQSLNDGEPGNSDLLCFLKRQLDSLDAMHEKLMEAVEKFNGSSKTYLRPKRVR